LCWGQEGNGQNIGALRYVGGNSSNANTVIRIYNIFWKNQTDGNASITYRYNIDAIDHTVGSVSDVSSLDEIARDVISDPAVVNILKVVTGDVTLLVDGNTVDFTYEFYGHR